MVFCFQKLINVGVMAARGLLENPALFAGHEVTPWKCVEKFVNYALSFGLNYHIFQHHLSEMTRGIFSKKGLCLQKISHCYRTSAIK
jgi:tRNA-dihydrouridine synthase